MGCIPVKSVTHPQPSNQPEAIMLNSNDLTQIRLTQLKLGGVGQDDPCPSEMSHPIAGVERTNNKTK